MFDLFHFQLNQRGYVLLLSVIVVGIVSGSIASTILLFGIGQNRSSLAIQEGANARFLADSCAQEVLEQLIQDDTYAGSEILDFDNGTCTVAAVSGSGQSNRTVQVTGVSGSSTKRVQVIVTTVGPPMVISSWQEVSSF
jgi:hypothetical protein